MKKSVNKINLTFIIVSALLLILGVGVSTALFYDEIDVTSNPITVGQVKINESSNLTFSGLSNLIPGATVVTNGIGFLKDENSANVYVRANLIYSSQTNNVYVQNFISQLNMAEINTFSNSTYEWKKFEADNNYYLVQAGTNIPLEVNTTTAFSFTTSPITIPLSVEEGTADGLLYGENIEVTVRVQAIQSFAITDTYTAISEVMNNSYNIPVDVRITDLSANGKILLNGITATTTTDLITTNIVNKGETAVIITPVPNEGYVVKELIVGGITRTLTNGCYVHTLSSTASENIIHAKFVEKQFAIIVNPTTNGTISPISGTLVNEGENQIVTLNPKDGYTVATFMVNGIDKKDNLKLNGNGTYTYTIENIRQTQTVSATFVEGLEIITVLEEGTGTISASEIVNGSAVVTITPGHMFIPTAFTVNGVNQINNLINRSNDTLTYTITSITKNQLVIASLARGDYAITTIAGENGNAYATPRAVVSGGSASVVITPNLGYKIESILVNGENLTSFNNLGHTLNLTNITQNKTVQVTFSILSFTVTKIQGEGTTLNVSHVGVQNYGTEISISADYDDQSYENFALNIFETGNPTNKVKIKNNKFYMPAFNVTVQTVATIKTYLITYSTGINGIETEVIDDQIKIHGTNLTLRSQTFTRTGYTQTGWSLTDGGVKAYDLGGSYAINADEEFFPFWTVNSYAITITPGTGTNILISPSETSQNYGTNITINATKQTGYSQGTIVLDVFNTNNPTTKVSLVNNKFVMPAYPVTISTTALALNIYNVNVSTEGGNGTVTSFSPSSTIVHGTNLTIQTSPSDDYMVDINGTTTTSGEKSLNEQTNTITIANVTADVAVVVKFKLAGCPICGSTDHFEASPAACGVTGHWSCKGTHTLHRSNCSFYECTIDGVTTTSGSHTYYSICSRCRRAIGTGCTWNGTYNSYSHTKCNCSVCSTGCWNNCNCGSMVICDCCERCKSHCNCSFCSTCGNCITHGWHPAASCGVIGHTTCDGKIHATPSCGVSGHCVSDGGSHDALCTICYGHLCTGFHGYYDVCEYCGYSTNDLPVTDPDHQDGCTGKHNASIHPPCLVCNVPLCVPALPSGTMCSFCLRYTKLK